MAHRFTTYNTQIIKESSKHYDIDNIMREPKSIVDLAHTVLNIHKNTQEHFYMLALNTKNVVVGIHDIHIGTLNATIVHPRDIFQRALLNNAAGIIVVHNHPSGDPEPSTEDIEVTHRLVDAGELIGIPLLDHIIIGEYEPENDINEYISLKEQHYINFN